MNENEWKTVDDIEYELEKSKQFPYLHKPREVAKQLVFRCGYGKVKEYQEEMARLTATLEATQQDKANLERTIEEIKEALADSGISIDADGNVNFEKEVTTVPEQENKQLQEKLEFANKSAEEAIEKFFEQQRKIKLLYKQLAETQIQADKDIQKAHKGVAKAIFQEMLEIVSANDNCAIVINVNDVRAIAKRYGVKL